VTASVTARPALPEAGSVGAWVLAARPRTLPASIVPVLVGTGVAVSVDGFALFPALAALFGSIAIQIGTNFANDLFDFEKGADTADRVGPTRAVQAGLLTPAQMRAGLIAAFGAAVLAGLYLTYVGGWPIVAIGLASIASGLAYTGGPWPLGYHGLGDLFVLVFFGLVAVSGTAYVQIGTVATALIVVNNVRDVETDTVAGKRTLAVRFGRTFGLVEYAALLAVAYAVPAAVALARGAWGPLLPLVTLPLAVRTTHAFRDASDGPAHNRCLAETGKLLALYGVLLAAGLALL